LYRKKILIWESNFTKLYDTWNGYDDNVHVASITRVGDRYLGRLEQRKEIKVSGTTLETVQDWLNDVLT
jgi:hypothetical protein